MTTLGLSESFKTMNQPGPTVTLFDGLFLGKYKNRDEKFGQNLYSICAFKIWDQYL